MDTEAAAGAEGPFCLQRILPAPPVRGGGRPLAEGGRKRGGMGAPVH